MCRREKLRLGERARQESKGGEITKSTGGDGLGKKAGETAGVKGGVAQPPERWTDRKKEK